MKAKIQADLHRIGMSFIRAFAGAISITEIANIRDMRGADGVLWAAAIAGIAASLRTLEAMIGVPVSSDNDQ